MKPTKEQIVLKYKSGTLTKMEAAGALVFWYHCDTVEEAIVVLETI